jgi:DNA-binding NtrC family response regulator
VTGRVLIIDDDQSMCELLKADLDRRGYRSAWFISAEEAFQALKEQPADLILTDLNLPGLNGIELCERAVANFPDVPVIVMTAFGSLETAVAAIRAGAYDFVTKPFDLDVIALAVQRALDHRRLRERVKILDEEARRSQRFDELVGESPPMLELYRQIDRIARSNSTVLIAGESGTGKELVAKLLHRRSPRREKPFVAVNCAAVPEKLIESELFGHVSGAFTDARGRRRGLFVEANGGTLFLDEIGDFPLHLQPKLLRSLEGGAIRPVGSDRETNVDVRVIAASHRDLQSAVDEGRFRDDLFFRINVITLELPPLRARGADILLIAQKAVGEFAERMGRRVTGISTAAAEKLLAYPWPGNVRELRNTVERAVALTQFEKISVEDLPERIRDYRKSYVILSSSDPEELVPLDEVERRYILHVLEAAGGNRSLAARILGLDRKTLYRKLRHLEGPDGQTSE